MIAVISPCGPNLQAEAILAGLRLKNMRALRFLPERFPVRTRLNMELGGKASGARSAEGKLTVDWSSVRSVWNDPKAWTTRLSPEVEGAYRTFSRRECDAAHEGLQEMLQDRLWINPPPAAKRALSLPAQLQAAVRAGFAVPRTLISNDWMRIRRFVAGAERPVYYRPLSSQVRGSVGKDQAAQFGPIGLRELEEPDRFRAAPAVVQESPGKGTGELVGVAGLRHWSGSEVPSNLAERCIALVSWMGLVAAGVELLKTRANDWIFLGLRIDEWWLSLEEKSGAPILDHLCEMLIQSKPDPTSAEGRPRISFREVEPLLRAFR